MIRLDWLTAAVTPRDMAPHPNFSTNGEIRPHEALAEVFNPRDWVSSRRDEASRLGPSFEWEVIDAIEASFTLTDLKSGARALRALIDPAFSYDPILGTVAVTALAVSLSEQGQESDALQILERAVTKVAGRPGMDLPVAFLMAQLGMRSVDLGLGDRGYAAEALSAFEKVTPDDFSVTVSQGTEWTSSRAVARTMGFLRLGIDSLIRWVEPPASNSWVQRVRREPEGVDLQMSSIAGGLVGDLITADFTQSAEPHGASVKHVWGAEQIAWKILLHHEFVANIFAAREWRGILGQWRAEHAITSGSVAGAQDVLQLLRRSKNKNVYANALNWVRADGPLAAMREEGAMLASTRSPATLNELDLLCIRRSSDLMSGNQLRQSIELVLQTLFSEKHPIESAGYYRDASGRLEAALLTLVDLAEAAGATEEVAGRVLIALLENPEWVEMGDLTRAAIERFAFSLDWDDVSAETRRSWIEMATSAGDGVESKITLAVKPSLGPPPADGQIADIQDVIDRLNSAFKHDMSMLAKRDAAAAEGVVLTHLNSDLNESRTGLTKFGGPSSVEVGVGLALMGGSRSLWESVIEYLTSDFIPYQFKSSALQRIATATDEAFPSSARELLAASVDGLFTGRNIEFLGRAVVEPFPPAAQVVARFGLLPDAEVIALTTRLTSSGSPAARADGGRVLVAVARRSAESEWAFALAMQLGADRVASVRATASQVFALMYRHGSRYSKQIEDQLSRALNGEGVLGPLLTLRGLEEVGVLPQSLRRDVAVIAESHISSVVRTVAADLLKNST